MEKTLLNLQQGELCNKMFWTCPVDLKPLAQYQASVNHLPYEVLIAVEDSGYL